MERFPSQVPGDWPDTCLQCEQMLVLVVRGTIRASTRIRQEVAVATRTGTRRQPRGERRIDQILLAAGVVFARVGYERATTNAIAAEAGISPGSLYQFFPNKEAIAGALETRYAEQMRNARFPEAAVLATL